MAAVLERVPEVATPALGRRRGFASGAREIDDAEVRVEGRLPDWLRGTLLLNGPALWELPRGHYQHWFDGLAMLHRVAIGADGSARYRSRFLQSDDYQRSIAAQAPAFGAFDTPDPAGWLDRLRAVRAPRVTDNAAVVMSRIGERWVATTEGHHVVGFDPRTLETSGHLRFDDGLHIQLMAAHGITDVRGDYWNVGVELGPKCTYRLFRVRAGTARREMVGSITVPKSGYLHAFAMTRRYALIWETAVRANPLGFLFTGRAYIRNFRWQPDSGSALHAVSLDDGKVTTWQVPPMMCFHAVQAYELGDDIVAELCVYDDVSVFEDLQLDRLRNGVPLHGVAKLARYVLRRGSAEARPETFGEAFELPQVHPDRIGQGRSRFAWGAAFDPASAPTFFDRTMRIDLVNDERRVWQRPNAVQLEPFFVPRPGSKTDDDGVLLVPTLADDDEATVIGVVDAHTMACEATLHAPQVVPFGFHAAWTGEPAR